tara:strand:+ start:911 stop:1276 length:366 start_codon:yes stop_codon:yes gene_type:complete
MQTLTIPKELPGLNQVIEDAKKHWSSYADIKKSHTIYVMGLAKRKLKPIREPVKISFVWYCKDKRRDPDNIASAKKFILDGLVDAKIIEGDGWKQIISFQDEFLVDKYNPRCVITLLNVLH